MTPSIKFNFSGWTDDSTGYGKANLHLLTALEKLTNGGISMEWERQFCLQEDHTKYYNEKEKEIVNKQFTLEKIGIIQSTPNFFKNIHNDYRIGWTMVEDNHIGKKWVAMCNEMDHIFVPCNGLVDVFKKYKVTKPITVIPEGYDPEEHKFIERKKKDVFTFLTVGWMDERKNWETMIQAFMSEFGPDEPVQFLIKNSCPHFGYKKPIDPRIKIIDHYLTHQELQKLYEMADCFVFTTHGEGFGIPPLEAMATGLPVILTNWLGLADMSDERYNYPIDPCDLNYHYARPEQQGFMANIDPSELMYWMRHIYEHQDEALEKGRRASEWVRNNWTWEHAAQKIIDVVSKIDETLPKTWKDNYEFTNAWLEDVCSDGIPGFMYDFRHINTNALQIGAYEGRWSLWMLHNILTHSESRLTDIDPYTTEETYLENIAKNGNPLSSVKERYFRNIDKCPYKDKVTTIIGRSEEELLKLPKNSFDLIYVDGSHLAKDVAIDARLSFDLLKVGGILFFDDYMWRMGDDVDSKTRCHEAINEFLVEYVGLYEIVHKDYQLAIQKTGQHA